MNKKIYIFIIIFTFYNMLLYSKEIFTLKKLIIYGLKHSYKIKELKNELKNSEARYNYIKKFYLPENIELNQNFQYSMENENSFDNYSTLNSIWRLPWVDINNSINFSPNKYFNENLEINIYNNEIYFSLEEAKLNLMIAKKNFYQQKEKIIIDIISHYFDVFKAKENIKINKIALKQAKNYLKSEKLYLKAGIKTKYDVLKASLQVTNIKESLKNAYNDMELSLLTLKYSAGIEVEKNIGIVENTNFNFNYKKNLSECITTGLKNRYDIMIAEKNLIIRKKRLKELKLKRWIIPSFGISYIYNSTKDNEGEKYNKWNIYFSLKIPFYNRELILDQLVEAESETKIGEDTIKDIKNRIIIEIKSAYFTLERNKNKIVLLQKRIEEAKEKLRIEELRYKVGANKKTTEFLENLKSKLGEIMDIDLSANLFNAQNNLILLQNEFYQAIEEYYISLANLYIKMGIGVNLEEVLDGFK